MVWTDHKNLQYIKKAKRLNSRQACWSLFFNRFDFSLSYRPGSKNTKPDALSRLFSPETVAMEPLYCVVGAVLTVVDRFSKMAHFIALPKLPSAKETADIMMNNVFRIHGFPQDIVLDRGPQFVSRF